MSHKAGIAQPLISNKTIIIVLAVCFSIIALTILHSLNDEKQNNKKGEGHEEILISIVENTKDIKVIEVPLSPETWSDWVELPMNFKNWEFGTASSWVEFQFLNGEHHKFKADEKSWWKNTPCRTFKLRGATGIATIVVKF
mgnify:CR=1 FL=1